MLTLTALMTLAAWGGSQTLVRDAARQRFLARHDEIVHGLHQRLTVYQQILHGALGLLNASGTVDREGWRTYVESLDLERHFPGVLGIGYAAQLPDSPDAMAELETSAREAGMPEFSVWPRTESAPRTPILWLEPMTPPNIRAIGFDMWSEPARRTAMTAARDSGEATVSGRVVLVQEEQGDRQPGFLVYLAHYAGERPPTTVADRRASLKGFVYAPFRIADFMTALRFAETPGIRLRLHAGDPDSPENLLFDTAQGAPWPDDPYLGLEAQARLALPGQPWTVSLAASPAITPKAIRWVPPLILTLGATMSLLSFASVRNASGLRRAERDRERLGRIVEEAGTEIYVLDTRTLRILQANRGARSNTGYTAADLARLTWLDLEPEVDRRQFLALSQGLRRGVANDTVYETWHRRRDGSTYPALVTLQIHRGGGDPPVYHALVQDITERRAQADAVAAALAEARSLLAEKETLLREVHHRVKNNLQVIWSLIRLEAAGLRDPAVRERLETVGRRIAVLGQIHEQLYGTENVSRVDIGEHVGQLCRQLAELHTHRNVVIGVTADSVTCDLETAIPLGLIANELIGNSLEHAFPDGRPGRVSVELVRLEAGIQLIVADDGVGRSDATPTGLGLRLIAALAAQLNATLQVVPSPGTRSTLTVPLPDVAAGNTGPASAEI